MNKQRTYHTSWIDLGDSEPQVHVLIYWVHDDGAHLANPTKDINVGWYPAEFTATIDGGEEVQLSPSAYASELEKGLCKLKEKLGLDTGEKSFTNQNDAQNI